MGTNPPMTHPLLSPGVVQAVERSASSHLGRPWVVAGFTDLNSRASHPSGILRGKPFSVFAKLADASGVVQFTAELRGHELIRPAVPTPTPIGDGIVSLDTGALLLLEALPESPARTADDWRSIGRTLAALHAVHGATFGLAAFDGFFGPLPQSNLPAQVWSDFYAERRVLPNLRSAVDSGHLPVSLGGEVERLVDRLPSLCGPEPLPALLHGDAQQNNFLTTAADVFVIDPCPYFGHPELDLALLDYFEPVPPAVFDGYRDHRPIYPGFEERRDLWRLYAYLAVVTVDSTSEFGRPFLNRIAAAVAQYS